MGNARCRRNSIKPGTTPQVHSHQSIVALQAQKKCHPGAMRLLGWLRRSLLSIRVVVGVISMSTSVSGNVFGSVLRITSVVPAALTLRYFCAYSARCPRRGYAWGVAPGCKLLHKQATPWPLEQAHGARLALFLRLQRVKLAGVIPNTFKATAHFPVTVVKNEKTNLHVPKHRPLAF